MNFLPPRGVARSLCVQSLVWATGNGVFATGSAVFFLNVTGLSPVQVGIGLSVAGALALAGAVPLGRVADRIGGRRAWLWGVLGEAAALALYPAIHGFAAFLALVALPALAEALAAAGRLVYQTAVLPRSERLRTLAFVRSAMNVGFFAGGGLAAVPLAIGTHWAYRCMVLAAALGLLVNALLIARLPAPPSPPAPSSPPTPSSPPSPSSPLTPFSAPEPISSTAPSPPTAPLSPPAAPSPPTPSPSAASASTSAFSSPASPAGSPAVSPSRAGVWRDRPFLALVALCSLLASHASLTTEVIPLWLTARTDAPRVMLAVLFAVNTAMCVALQVVASRGADTPAGIVRALRRGGLVCALACLPLALAGAATGGMTIALLLTGSALVTLGELWQSAGYWGLTTELPPPAARGEYVGAARMSFGLQSMLGPASLTFLAMHGDGPGWAAIAAAFVAGAVLTAPVMRWVTSTPRSVAMTPTPALADAGTRSVAAR
ncbi:MFS transporter [Dactylosporangium sp. NPDC049140]|uniref:MFS transporter n=1 Tax=Dactylosporangium sp. NPDC049140 TaxID=3155647 RepID=UPI00340322CD